MPSHNFADAGLVPRKSLPSDTAASHRIVLPWHPEDRDEVSISIVACEQQRRTACELVNQRYGWRGYGDGHTISAASSHTSFVVACGGITIGTLTLAVDSDCGLAVDASFPREVDAMRRLSGASVCELTKFAFDMVNPSKRVLAALFHTVFLYGRHRYNCTDLLIEVNPRHRRFYEVMLGFERVGEIATNESVAAPSQLMRLKVDRIAEQIEARVVAAPRASDRSLYTLFFEPAEASRILRQLVAITVAAEQSAWDACETNRIDVKSRSFAAIDAAA